MATPVDLDVAVVAESKHDQQESRERKSKSRERRSVKMKNVIDKEESSTASEAVLQGEENQEEERETTDSQGTIRVFFAIKALFGFMFYLLVLVCTVFSKLTLVSLTDKLRNVTHCNDTGPSSCSELMSKMHRSGDRSIAISLYWQLLLVISIPTFLTFIRSLVFGVLGKTTRTFPWPKMKSAIVGGIASVLEVVAISVFVFLVLAELPPGISILLLSGVFFCQFAVDFVYTKKICCDPTGCTYPQYDNLEDSTNGTLENVSGIQLESLAKILRFLKCFLENKTMKLVAISLQLSSIVVFIALWCIVFMKEENVHLKYLYRLRPMIALPICLLVLSFIWTNKFQDWITRSYRHQSEDNRTARYKSSFINSTIRLVLYPFVTYIIFAYATPYQIDPWCISSQTEPSDESCINFSGETLAVFLVQVLTTLCAYMFAWVACTMTLSPYGMALPLLAATPLAAICYYIHEFAYLPNVLFFPSFTEAPVFHSAYPWGPVIVGFLWIAQMLGIGFYIITRRNIILSEDSDMFLTPHYDGVFFEQHMILNRQVRRFSDKRANATTETQFIGNTICRTPRTIFICSTMYRENTVEMRQMLTSINRVAKHYEREKRMNRDNSDTYESHIFFDGALNGTQLQEFGLQLLSLLEETLGVKLNKVNKRKMPYGMCLRFHLNRLERMNFFIHFKDKNLVKPKKRWSQVMYMNYVINHRIKNDPRLTADNTFILTTDADIDFTAKSAVVLLDMLESNPMVGAVCARTHPKGSGPLYWYQVFDYAIGHWFQKPAEHLLGCVLCSPGCFSVFRCSALQEVIETYSSLATNGMEFLMKDMGEDRWLCTLLIKKGWRLEYCAISEDLTYCPLDFGEFYGQRRRWIPSTIANLSLLISETASITRRNDTVSILFILFQGIMILSTAISPATVILVIASGLQSAFRLSDPVVLLIISLLIIVSVLYGAVCLFASPKTQIDVAKVLSFIFAIVMIIVIAGIFKDVIHSIFPDKPLVYLQGTNCTLFNGPNHTKALEDCTKSARFINSIPNSAIGEKVKLPISTSVLYLGIFAVTFVIAAFLHLPEFTCLFHSIWYLLALPSGYLLLLIYSAANLDSQSWGTRESGGGKDKGLLGWGKYFKLAWQKLVSCCVRSRCCKPDQDELPVKAPVKTEEVEKKKPDLGSRPTTPVGVDYPGMDREAREWLERHGSREYIEKFFEHGYTTLHYISGMKVKDLEAIGIDKRGFRLRLEKAANKLPCLPIHVDVPESVDEWLRNLRMEEYKDLFKSEGYETGEDIENLKGLEEKDLRGMGITKRAHLQRLTKALHNLAYPKEVEQKMYHTKGVIEGIKDLEPEDEEKEFWKDLIAKKLKPLSSRLTSVTEVKESLKSLRNTMLMVLFLVNIMWIIALYVVQFPRLSDYNLNPRAFQLLFLAVYSFIIIVQFFMMICHRGITLVHYFGRITPVQVVAPAPRDLDFEYVSYKQPRP